MSDDLTFVGGNFDNSAYSNTPQEDLIFTNTTSSNTSSNLVDVEAELRTRDTLPDGFEGKLSESALDLIDCGEMVYVPSLNTFMRRGKIKNPPDKPEGAGPCSGKSRIEYTFEFVTTDPDGDNISYYVDWGDGNNTSWIGPFESGQAFAVAHTWYERGCYIIKCQAIDIWGDESEWLIHMFWIDRSKTLSYSLLLNFLEQYQPINLILQRLMINLQNK